MKKPTSKIHVLTKTTWHCFIGMIDYIGIPLLLAYLSTFILPISQDECLWGWIERTVFCFTLYEVVLIGIRKMQIDTRKDALLALKTAYEKAALYCESGNKDIYDNITIQIERVLDNGVLNQLDVIKDYQNLREYMNSQNLVCIKYQIINLQ